jgi:hypothetical protein
MSSVLFEHILVSDMSVILEVDTKVLGLDFFSSEDLLDLKDFSVRFFDFVLSSHNLPEFRFGKGSIGSNDFDDCDLWLFLSFVCLDPSVD